MFQDNAIVPLCDAHKVLVATPFPFSRETLIDDADVEGASFLLSRRGRKMGTQLRFNDLMQTVLAAGERSGLGAVTLWRQCVDMLAQNDRPDRAPLHPRERAALLERLKDLRPKLSETQRIATVVELGGRLRSPTLIGFFAEDKASICAAAMARAQLPDGVWPPLLHSLSPTARGVLRGRRDLGPQTVRGLEAFASADLVLTSDAMVLTPAMMVDAEAVDAAPEDAVQEPIAKVVPLAPLVSQDQIRSLVDRIERFTSNRRAPDMPSQTAPAAEAPPAWASSSRAFSFETDVSGTIVWVGEGPRAGLIGLSLAEPAPDGGSGPDGHVAGAFVRRSGFQSGRYAIVGGAMAGEWRMSATPFFDPRSGRFQGYRGQARRPHMHEVASAPPPEPTGIAGLSSDSLRQLVHELRTPLNAILGFAEIIEQQLFGEAGPEYREMAGKIAIDARHLLSAFDDLDLAARVSRGDETGTPRAVDPALLVTQIASRFQIGGDVGGGAAAVQVDIATAQGLPHVRIDPIQGERMVQHLLRTLVSVAPAGEAVTGSCWFQPDAGSGRVVLALDRPSSLDGMEEAQLLDPGYTPEGEWADGPLLGLGFSLRLIRSLAAGCGGSLDIDAHRFLLAMPAIADLDEGEAGQA
jgi:hypothetical protein